MLRLRPPSGGFEQAPSDIDRLGLQILNIYDFFLCCVLATGEGAIGEKFNLPNTCSKWTS